MYLFHTVLNNEEGLRQCGSCIPGLEQDRIKASELYSPNPKVLCTSAFCTQLMPQLSGRSLLKQEKGRLERQLVLVVTSISPNKTSFLLQLLLFFSSVSLWTISWCSRPPTSPRKYRTATRCFLLKEQTCNNKSQR